MGRPLSAEFMVVSRGPLEISSNFRSLIITSAVYFMRRYQDIARNGRSAILIGRIIRMVTMLPSTYKEVFTLSYR